jgi:GPH family glycoside/pentoside/hexuronide:cation symporter
VSKQNIRQRHRPLSHRHPLRASVSCITAFFSVPDEATIFSGQAPSPGSPPSTDDNPARLPLRRKLAWALGSLGDNYAGNTISQLKDPVYTVALGVAPEMVGWALSVPRLFDAFLEPMIGFWSDSWQGRWGRRRPFIFVGAVSLALTMTLLWFPPSGSGWSQGALTGYLLVTSMFFYAAYALFLVPYRALGLEQTQDYHERTRLQAWGMILGLLGGLGIPWLYKLALFFGAAGSAATAPPREVILTGARWLGLGVGGVILISCLVPAIACRRQTATGSSPRTRRFAAIVSTARNRPFAQMLGMNFFAVIGMYSPVTAAVLVSIYFLFQGAQDPAATLIGFLGMAQMLGSLAGVPFNTRLSTRIGKRGAALAALVVGAAGFGSLWITLLPSHPYWALGSQFFIGWGMQGVWLMSATMNADVCDSDELATGYRREGLYGAVFALEQKIASAAAVLLGGYLVSRCGFRPHSPLTPEIIHRLRTVLVATPVAGLALAAVCIFGYPLSQDRVREIQDRLRARSGHGPIGR